MDERKGVATRSGMRWTGDLGGVVKYNADIPDTLQKAHSIQSQYSQV